jgi:Domain of unknown function (DUF4270)
MRQNILMPIMTFMTRSYHNFPFFFRFNSVSNNFLFVLRPALFVAAIFILISCEEGPTKIGSELLPGNDFVTVSSLDTLSIWSYTRYDSIVPTNDPTVAFVGNIQDPYFGTTTAEFVSQIRIGSAWTFGPVTIDSVKMSLRLLTVKGGSSDQGHFIRLSEIADQIYTDSLYYSNNHTDTTDFETIVQLPKLTPDTINNISVSLPVEFGEYLVRDTTKLFYSTTKPDFRSWFKGLYFRISASSDPLIVAFSLVTQVTSGGNYNNFFVLYMHDTANVNHTYYFILDPVHTNAGYNKFSRDFSTADPDKRIGHINDYTYRDTLTYLQYLNGVYTKIIFPGLDSLRKEFSKGKFSINKARISLPVYYDRDRYTVLTVPSNLRLRYTDKDGLKHDVPDYGMDLNNRFFDGTLHVTDSTYYFNIPTYIQTYLEDKNNDYKPELEIYEGPTGLSSVILRANASKTPVKFELTYTKF